jgi:hypothetical protein
MDLDDYVKKKLILNNISIFNLKDNQERYTKRQINKRLELIMKIHDSVLRSEQLIEKVFLNYKFLFELFNQQKYFSLANYCYQYDFLYDIFDIMNIKKNQENRNNNRKLKLICKALNDKSHLVAIAGLIQSIVIVLNESLIQYPKTIGNQICSKINCLNGLSEDFTIFIRDSIKLSAKDCSLIAHTQTSQLSDARVRSVHNFFSKIIDYQNLGNRDDVERDFFLYDKAVAFFDWNRDESKQSRLIKEIEIQPAIENQYEILRVFEFKENVNKFGIIVATKTSIQCFDDFGREISKQKIKTDEIIKDVLIVCDKGFIVFYDNKNFINIFDTFSKRGLPIHQQKFESNITFCNYNRIKHAGWTVWNNDVPLFISIYFEHKEIVIFQVLNDTTKGQLAISLKSIFKQKFNSLKPISGGFHLNSGSNYFQFFVTTNENKFLSIELTENNEIINQGIKTNIENNLFNVISYYDEIVVLTDNLKTYFFNNKTNKWFSIPDCYKRVVVLKQSEDFYRIFAYNDKYFELFLLK